MNSFNKAVAWMVVWGCLGLASNGWCGAPEKATWPSFHGPRRDNLAPDTDLLKTWPSGGPRMLWKYTSCGNGYAAASIADGLVFTSGDFGDAEFVIALHEDGRLAWKQPNGKAWRGAQPGARTTPTYDEGAVYHLGPHGRLAAFEARTGRELWAVDIRQRFDATLGLWGYTENLLVDGNQIVCMPGGASGRVVALDKKTGRTLWANTEIRDRAAYSSPILAEHEGVRQWMTLARSSVLGVDLRTGKLLWSHSHESFCDQNVTSPIYHDGRVFVSSGHKAGARVVALSADIRSATQRWFGTSLDNCHGGVVLLDGYLYGSGCRMYNKGLLCVEFATGKVQYRAEEIGKVSITHAEGMLYCLDNDGEMLLVRATPQSARIVSRFPLPKRGNDHSLTHPVVCGGRLYLRHLEDLFVYDIRQSAAGNGSSLQ